MIEIKRLDRAEYAGRKLTFGYETNGYYDIERESDGFRFVYKPFGRTVEKTFDDEFFSEWLDDPVGFGAFEGGRLIGYAEGFLEKWNNRYRISNIGIFESSARGRGLGRRLMDTILVEAEKSGARMVVLETQTCNENAIAFYKRMGFEIIGFDLYSYTNTDPEAHEVRIEMGKFI